MKKQLKIFKEKTFWLTILLTIIIFCLAISSQHIYPFGNKIFGYIDFDSGYIPVYYKLWDLLHFWFKCLDINLNINYPYILEVPSVANRVHILKQDVFTLLDNFNLLKVIL